MRQAAEGCYSNVDEWCSCSARSNERQQVEESGCSFPLQG